MNASAGYATPHARRRMAEMRLEWAEVRAALEEPEVEYGGRPDDTGLPRRIAVAGRLAVVLSPDRHTVVTVLWRGLEGRVAA